MKSPRPKVRTDDKIQALVQRLSTVEDYVRSTSRDPSLTTVTDVADLSSTPQALAPSSRPTKRQRTESTLGKATPTLKADIESVEQPVNNEARSLISRELSTNGLLSNHQRTVLETAVSFVDQLTHAPVPTITDRSTFDACLF
jgi:hypothetical protein